MGQPRKKQIQAYLYTAKSLSYQAFWMPKEVSFYSEDMWNNIRSFNQIDVMIPYWNDNSGDFDLTRVLDIQKNPRTVNQVSVLLICDMPRIMAILRFIVLIYLWLICFLIGRFSSHVVAVARFSNSLFFVRSCHS